MRIGLLFGSFNPIHAGHMIIAGYMLGFTPIERVWFVVSPQNPLKPAPELAPATHRLAMVRVALRGFGPQMQVCEVEMGMPRPSYTIHTLDHLAQRHPEHQLAVIMGADALATVHLWKEYQRLFASHTVYVYPRLGFDIEAHQGRLSFQPVPAPIIELSSTFIRSAIAQGKDARCFLPPGVEEYIAQYGLYISRADP